MSAWFHPAAEVEHLDHVAYYEACRPGLGAAYLTEFEAVLAAAIERPARFPFSAQRPVRIAHLRRFPVSVLFRVADGNLHVLAVAHKRRRPTYWAPRL